MAVASNLNLGLYLARERTLLGQKFLRFCVLALIPISIVPPVVRLNEDFWLKLEQLLLPVVAVIFVWFLLAGLARPIRLNALFMVAPLYCVCIASSILYGSQVIGHPLLARDFFELPKTLFPVMFFTLAYEADLSEASLRTLAKIMFPTILIVCLYAYGQWFDMGFIRYLQPFYSGGLHDDGGLSHYRRVYSTLSNPNHLGMLMTWVIVIFTTGALFRIGSRFWNMVLILASLATLAMTGSRYGLITTVAALFLVFFLPAPSEGSQIRRRRILLASLPILLAAFFAVTTSNRATLDRVKMLETPLKENSLRLRLDGLWRDATDKIVESPVLGHGPARVIFSNVYTDSEYLQILKQFGVVGFLVYLCYFLVPLGMIWSGLRRVRQAGPVLEQHWPATYWAVCIAFILVITALAMNIGMATYTNQSLVAFLWMWLGIGASCAKRIMQISTFPREGSYFPGVVPAAPVE